MTRRTVAALVACVSWAVAPGAGAQTTTSSTSTSSSTSSTSTTSTSTTSTTFPNPCAGRPCTDQPPAALLSGVNGEVRLDRGSTCWTRPNPDVPGGFVSFCADVFDQVPDALLVVRAGETLSLRFDTVLSPTFVQLDREEQSTQLTPGNPARLVADLPLGVQVVHFFTRWSQGDASYSVRLDVRAATTAQDPRPLALTG
jgi:hypothetical protein